MYIVILIDRQLNSPAVVAFKNVHVFITRGSVPVATLVEVKAHISAMIWRKIISKALSFSDEIKFDCGFALIVTGQSSGNRV